MSERGSYCTEYMYCEDCAKAVFEAVTEAGLHAVNVVDRRIVAGCYKMTPGCRGEEIMDFEHRVSEIISGRICHEVRIAVMADSGESALYKVSPKDAVAWDEWIQLIESKGGYWTSG